MPVRVGINGFGRIGRNVFRAAKARGEARPVERLSNRARLYRDDTLTFTIAVVQQQTNPPPPSPE